MSLLVEAEPVRREVLETDPDAIGQILFNLVDNACKYAAGEGRRVELRASRDGARIRLRVTDHGPGVPAETARRIFAPFERGGHDQDPAPGIGLGLSLSRALARRLGGDLVLCAAPGAGACFEVDLPAASR
jgi:signal transduction histidine kinase